MSLFEYKKEGKPQAAELAELDKGTELVKSEERVGESTLRVVKVAGVVIGVWVFSDDFLKR